MTKRGRQDSHKIHTVQSLRGTLAEVSRLLLPARRLVGDPDDSQSVGDMQANEIPELDIRFEKSLQCAIRDLERWGIACLKAWNKAVKEREQIPRTARKEGAFSAKKSGNAEAAARPKARKRAGKKGEHHEG